MTVRSPEAAPKAQLDRDAWVHAAMEVLAKEGITGVRVETLAKRCKVTKGSFYWHFKDRQDLLDAILQFWKEGRIKDILKQTQSEPGKELARIFHVIDVYSAARNRKGMHIELAIRDWARRDAAVEAVVEEVEKIRLECAGKLFLARGFTQSEASSRSLLLYSYVFGQSLMTFERDGPEAAAVKQHIAEVIAKT